MTLMNRIAKKLRRQTRVKGTYTRQKLELTQAELLIQSWYGKNVPHESITSQATLWERSRIRRHTAQWDNTPKSTKVSRQVRRYLERKGPQAVLTA